MQNKKILIVNGYGYEKALSNLGDYVHNIEDFIKNPNTYKLILFSGGADVSPKLYGHTSPKGFCGCDHRRDVEEKEVFDLALDFNIPMVGICRGSQFLNVMCGGTLVHHLDNHGVTHSMRTNFGELISVTSTHHQMSIPSNEGHILAWSDDKRSDVYYGDEDVLSNYNGPEVEAIYYPGPKVFAVQYHPEYMRTDSRGFDWFRTGALDLMTLSEADFKIKYLVNENKSVAAI